MSLSWREPVISVIHLTNGQTVEAEINGRDLEKNSGYVFTQGREITAARIDDSDEWEEVRW